MHLALWLLVFISVVHSSTCCTTNSLRTKFEWKYFDYVWKSPKHKQDAIKSGQYDYKNNIPIDVDEAPDGRTFVTIISGEGVPATLNTVSYQRGSGGPLLKPYPNWSWYNQKNCTGITGVLRVAIDKCNRLWVLDTGRLGFGERVCPSQLLVFDLSSDRLVKRIVIPNKLVVHPGGEGLLGTPIVETYGRNCENFTVYIADIEGALLVVKKNIAYRLNNKVFKPEEAYSHFEIANETFELSDGVLGVALSPRLSNGKRYLAFRPLASRSLYATDTRTLNPHFDSSQIKYKGIDILPSQAAAQAFSSRGTLFYGLTKEIAIGCWNINKPLKSENLGIAVVDKERLQFTSGMKIISSNGFEYLITLSNRFQKVDNTLNFNETNFRVLKASVASLVKGTVCDGY